MNPLSIHPRWYKRTRRHLDEARAALKGETNFTLLYHLIHTHYAGFIKDPVFPGQVWGDEHSKVFAASERLVQLTRAGSPDWEVKSEINRLDAELRSVGMTRADLMAAMDRREASLRTSVDAMQKLRNDASEFMMTRPVPNDPSKPTQADVRADAEWGQRALALLRVSNPRLEDETAASHAYFAWEFAGSNTFSLSGELTEMLHNTDVGDVRPSDLSLPYDALYLHFGKPGATHYPGRPESRLDGAYVAWSAGATDSAIAPSNTLAVVLTASGGTDPGALVPSVPDDRSRPSMSVVLEFVRVFSEAGEPLNPDLVTSDSYISYRSRVTGSEVHLTYRDALTLAKQPTPDGAEMRYVDEGLRLVLNSLSYMSMDDAEERVGYAEDAGERDLERASALKGRQRKQELDRIDKRGYTVVRFLGPVGHSASSADTGREVRTHWRRGHWRRQRFGTAHSESRRQWIRPTVVRRDLGEPRIGHAYELDHKPKATAVS